MPIFTLTQLQDATDQIKSGKAPGLGEIPLNALKETIKRHGECILEWSVNNSKFPRGMESSQSHFDKGGLADHQYGIRKVGLTLQAMQQIKRGYETQEHTPRPGRSSYKGQKKGRYPNILQTLFRIILERDM